MKEEVFDVVVVGGGGSGLAAAIEARQAGARVILLEKNDKLGGSTAWSVGSITTTRSPHQLRAGVRDTPDDHFRDMPLFAGDIAGRDNDELRRIHTLKRLVIMFEQARQDIRNVISASTTGVSPA